MICKFCKSRFADYPREDYFFEKNGIMGIFPKSNESNKRRIIVFRSNEEGDCGCGDYNFMRNRILKRRTKDWEDMQ